MASEEGRLWKRRRVWWIQVYDHSGRRLRFSTGTRDEKKARRILRQKIRELDEGRLVSTPTNLTVDDMLDALEEEYRVKGRASMDRLKSARGHLEEYFTGKVLSIRGRDLRRYLLYRTEQESAAMATVRYELAILRRAFVLAQRDEVLDRVPAFPEFEATPSRELYVTDGDHLAILEQLDDPVRHLVSFLY
jgi:hypothetical protein